MSHALRLCKERWPIGLRLSVLRQRWIGARAERHETLRIDGTVVKHWRATGDRPAITVLCDDGIEASGEPCILDVRNPTGKPPEGGVYWVHGVEPKDKQMDLFGEVAA